MTKEEFGFALFDAISACARVQQALKMIASEVHKGRDVSELSNDYARLKDLAKLSVQAPGVTDEDAARLVLEYPWLNT
jgi:hypothetical protein